MLMTELISISDFSFFKLRVVIFMAWCLFLFSFFFVNSYISLGYIGAKSHAVTSPTQVLEHKLSYLHCIMYCIVTGSCRPFQRSVRIQYACTMHDGGELFVAVVYTVYATISQGTGNSCTKEAQLNVQISQGTVYSGGFRRGDMFFRIFRIITTMQWLSHSFRVHQSAVGSAPDPAGGAYSGPPEPLPGLRGT